MSDRHHRQIEIEAFIARLRDRPWIEPTLVDMIAHGLRTAVRDPNPALCERLREVIRDDEELTVADQLTQISRITATHLNHEQAQSYLNMENAADMAAGAEKKAAVGAEIGAGFQFAAGLATLFTGGAGGAPSAVFPAMIRTSSAAFIDEDRLRRPSRRHAALVFAS